METVWEGRIAGIFEGYQGGRAYELSDGSRWRQEDRTGVMSGLSVGAF